MLVLFLGELVWWLHQRSGEAAFPDYFRKFGSVSHSLRETEQHVSFCSVCEGKNIKGELENVVTHGVSAIFAVGIRVRPIP